MLRHYLVLGLSYPTGDEEVRKAYLELVKRYPPERFPEEFNEVSTAYEALKDERSRIETELLGFREIPDPDEEILHLSRVRKQLHGRPGLHDLVAMEDLSLPGEGE
jgi:curved DNA-binding protein CbpA